MASEKFANLAETALASGYTSGTTTLSVTSAAGFPTAGVFRVRLGNVGKTIWRVDSVSGTTFTGAAEANDANANSGDTCIIVASRQVAERFIQTPNAGEIAAYAGVSAVDRYGPVYKLNQLDQSAWSWVNQGTATVTQSNGVVYLEGPSQAGLNARSRVVTAPATPYTITALIQAVVPAMANIGVGLVWRESGTSKLTFLMLSQTGVRQANFTNDTTFSADVTTFTALFAAGTMVWLRMTDDGTNLITSFSFDGVIYHQLASVLRGSFFTTAPNQMGLSVFCTSSAGIQGENVFSWLQT